MSLSKKEREEFEADYKVEPSLHVTSEGEITSIKPSGVEILRGNGGSTSYYDLPKGARILNDLILHKDMRHGIGEAFCAIYRLNDNGEYLRNLNKVKFYIDEAIKYEENK